MTTDSLPDTSPRERVLSGMRPTGALHLGHFHGALKNWVRLQDGYDCFYFVADWHALTTHYEDREVVAANTYDMVTDWLAAGIDPDRSTIFIQSRLPEHAELFTLLAMGTPLGWLERMPTYKDQIEKLKDKDLATYGFLGYPLLQAADILIYNAAYVPVGEDQAPHVEITREVARRFNHLYGREPNHEALAQAAVAKLGKAGARAFEAARKAFQEGGSEQALEDARTLIADSASLGAADRERLEGYLRGTGKAILREPHALHTEVKRLPGLDGAKMSKSYGNAIAMREEPAEVEKKIRRMQTDPARVRRSDPGEPERCPVWQFHLVYSDEPTKAWAAHGCRTAGIGCLDCKQPVIDAIKAEQQPWRERAEPYLTNPRKLHWIVEVGTERARTVARETMRSVRDAMGLSY
ncbi:tryptophan--tRNA ligase [Piscinibacter koreensis]|uniref:Tryptophan--tRNA ligase n=1 Tax=Piscinibacter koreensis TaxID=2742824 RepID=A0A7Y6NLP9_9BURK|nr:tryptophan--tRNA ligase [Schlegelella koreensis]NUZ05483.1 tryptophan--tRNA ligase [Schlegelella koreensis]